MPPTGDALATRTLDYAAYLALERETQRKYEWLDGRVFALGGDPRAMAGGTLAHSALSAAVTAALHALAKPCGCLVFSSDGKVRVAATGLATYPDVSLVCGELECDPADANAMTNPAVLVEVLSEATEAYDRGEKFAHYRRLPSLQSYVLVSQREPRVECYSRDAEGRWVLEEAGPGGAVRVPPLAGPLALDPLYAGIALTAPARRALREGEP